MATLTVTPNLLQDGTKPVLLELSDLPPQSIVPIMVTKPCKETSKLEFTTTLEGTVTEEIYLDNGVGTYTFDWYKDPCLENACHPSDSQSVTVTSCPVDTPSLAEVVNLDIVQDNYLLGGQAIAIVSAKPNSFGVLISSGGTGITTLPFTTDSSGIASIQFPLTTIMVDVVAMVNSVQSTTRRLVVADNSINEPVLVQSRVTIEWLIGSTRRQQNTPFSVTMRVVSASPDPMYLTVTPVSGALLEATRSHLVFEPIAPYATRDFSFFLTGAHSNMDRLAMSKIYQVELKDMSNTVVDTFPTEVSAIIEPTILEANLQLTQVVFDRAIYEKNNTLLKITVSNLGESDLVDVTFSAPFPELSFNGVYLARGKSYTKIATFNRVVKGINQFSFEGSSLQASSQGVLIVGTGSGTASILYR